MAAALTSPNLPKLESISKGHRSGKVREVYDLGDSYLIVSTDRISAFDVVMPNGIPDKGRVLNQMSAFWFNKLEKITPNHIITTDDQAIAEKIGFQDPDLTGRCTLAHKALPLTIECVVRAYLAGSFYKEYRATAPENGIVTVHGIKLPSGMKPGDKLPSLIFTPATKAESGHDENISLSQASERVGHQVAEEAMEKSLAIFEQASAHAASKGLILADTKFEFGESDRGLTWIDEALTPDSTRYWEATEQTDNANRPGYDKQFVRDWLEQSGWDKTPPAPVLPEDVVNKTREIYLTALQRITGQTLRK